MDGVDMQNRIQQLERQLMEAQCAKRDLFFVNVLAGGVYESEEALRAAAQEVEILFPNALFLVVTAKKEHWGTLYQAGQSDQREQHFLLRNALENGFPGVCCAANVHGEMTAILNLPALPEAGMRGIVQDANHILEVLEAEFGIELTIAISRVYHSVMELPQAYQDTQHILEYQQLMGEDAPVTDYEALTHLHIKQSETSYLDLEQKLLSSVRCGDFTGLQIALHELISNEFGVTRPTVDTFRFRVYGVVNTLLYLMHDIQGVVGHDVIQELEVGPRLTSAVTVQDIVREMDDILDNLAQRVGAQGAAAPPAWVEQARAYVRENFKNPDVTVASVADWLHLTPTYCSKVYREVFGIRLLDEIQLLRLEEAKKLLRGSENLSTIAEAAGFPSALTMSRAFKRHEGVLPSSYRNAKINTAVLGE